MYLARYSARTLLNACPKGGATQAWSMQRSAPALTNIRSLAVTGRHSKNVAGKKNKLDAIKTKLYTRLSIKIIMVMMFICN
jgi:hypothetical protein